MNNTNGSTKTPEDYTARLIIALGERQRESNAILQVIALSLQSIERHLQQIAVASQPAPNFQRDIAYYPNFDWSEIGATILKEDSDGVSAVEWNGQVFTRRAPSNKFDAAVWFSRCAGKDGEGNNKYVRLITFKASAEAEPIAEKTKKLVAA